MTKRSVKSIDAVSQSIAKAAAQGDSDLEKVLASFVYGIRRFVDDCDEEFDLMRDIAETRLKQGRSLRRSHVDPL